MGTPPSPAPRRCTDAPRVTVVADQGGTQAAKGNNSGWDGPAACAPFAFRSYAAPRLKPSWPSTSSKPRPLRHDPDRAGSDRTRHPTRPRPWSHRSPLRDLGHSGCPESRHGPQGRRSGDQIPDPGPRRALPGRIRRRARRRGRRGRSSRRLTEAEKPQANAVGGAHKGLRVKKPLTEKRSSRSRRTSETWHNGYRAPKQRPKQRSTKSWESTSASKTQRGPRPSGRGPRMLIVGVCVRGPSRPPTIRSWSHKGCCGSRADRASSRGSSGVAACPSTVLRTTWPSCTRITRAGNVHFAYDVPAGGQGALRTVGR